MEHIAIAEQYVKSGLLRRDEGLNYITYTTDKRIGTHGRSYSAAVTLTLTGIARAGRGDWKPAALSIPAARLSVTVWADEDDLVSSAPAQANFAFSRAMGDLHKSHSSTAGVLRVMNPDPDLVERLFLSLSGAPVPQPAGPGLHQHIGIVRTVPRS